MRTLLVYATSKGYAGECAQKIAEQIGRERVDSIRIGKGSAVPTPEGYEQIIIGGSVHAGMLPKRLRDYCSLHEPLLLDKKVALFLCGIREEEKDQMLKANFPQTVLDHAHAVGWFGGRMRMADYNRLVRMVLRKITGSDQDIIDVRPEAVERFSREVAL
jgi:menaquinone-dependent protoporphyrinogen oxidase